MAEGSQHLTKRNSSLTSVVTPLRKWSQGDQHAPYHEGIHIISSEIILRYKKLIDNLKERNHLDDLGTEGMIILSRTWGLHD
jgi:hypothetical protein